MTAYEINALDVGDTTITVTSRTSPTLAVTLPVQVTSLWPDIAGKTDVNGVTFTRVGPYSMHAEGTSSGQYGSSVGTTVTLEPGTYELTGIGGTANLIAQIGIGNTWHSSSLGTVKTIVVDEPVDARCQFSAAKGAAVNDTIGARLVKTK
ncbi:hypothetical protein [Bifidobacterium callimiconis]|uniref:Uncharacterized protein n=1 Tax=Bifidobacterium callimiconis TaxID=2306973 RepID=A0A430FIN8_9BIFI|nr:hypothetical protein [Bifidobacterium callimiconis]RSX52641.1 hypothetical protein D2E23_0369 [Bifidobacterium callimiconis]